MANNIFIPCHCCGRQLPVRSQWFICDSCGYRICPSCIPRHRGPYSSIGGTKCSQCCTGMLRWHRSAE